MSDDAPPRSVMEDGVVAAAVYKDGVRLADVAIDDAGEWSRRPGHVVWIGLHEPSPQLLDRVREQFDLHPLAIEDAFKAHQFPKLEQYGESLFLVARTAQMQDGSIEFGETHLFVGRGYVVSVRHGASRSYAQVRARAESRAQQLSEGEDFILYAILDFIVDNYFPVLESVQGEVEQIEGGVLSPTMEQSRIQHLFDLRRDLLRLRNAVAPLVDVCRGLERTDVVAIDAEMRPLFRDVTDHIRRVQEGIDTMREVLAFAFEASLMNAQMIQTDIARRLAAWAGIIAVPTLIAGVYGMNFKNMPELDWRYGYPLALLTMAATCALLYRQFRRKGWL